MSIVGRKINVKTTTIEDVPKGYVVTQVPIEVLNGTSDAANLDRFVADDDYTNCIGDMNPTLKEYNMGFNKNNKKKDNDEKRVDEATAKADVESQIPASNTTATVEVDETDNELASIEEATKEVQKELDECKPSYKEDFLSGFSFFAGGSAAVVAVFSAVKLASVGIKYILAKKGEQ